MQQSKKSSPFLKSWKSIKHNFTDFMKKNDLKEMQQTLKKAFKSAQKDLNSMVDKDLNSIRDKFHDEKEQIEKIIDRFKTVDLEKALKFVDQQKKEIEKLQHKLEYYISQSAKKVGKATGKKKTSRGRKSASSTTKSSRAHNSMAAKSSSRSSRGRKKS